MLFQRAFAKINLGLRVLRRRPDGYHEIETIFTRVNITDEIFVTPAEKLEFECDRRDLSSETNLVYRAAVLLQESLGVARGARIVLRKNIPVGSGLGGGSADAAAALRLLCRLWGENPTEEHLGDLALRLGSDVPFFLRPGSAHATSRGERLTYFRLEIPYPIMVVSPDLHIPTGEAYGAVAPHDHAGSDDLKTLLIQHLGLPELLGNVMKNDFEQPIFRRHPVLHDLRTEIESAGALYCAMSGSGSSLFALFQDEAHTRGAMERVKDRCAVFYTPPGFRPGLEILDIPGIPGIKERPVD